MMMPSIFGENLFDDLFDRGFGMLPAMTGHDPLYGKHAAHLMKTDVRETADRYEMDIDLPGFRKDDVRVELKEGYLTISASKGLDKSQQDEEGRFLRQERYAGAMSRSFYIGEEIEAKDVSARFEDGILRLTLPKQMTQRLPAQTAIPIE